MEFCHSTCKSKWRSIGARRISFTVFLCACVRACMLVYRVVVDGVWAASVFGSVLLSPGRSLAQFSLLSQLCRQRARRPLKTSNRGPGMYGWALPAARLVTRLTRFHKSLGHKQRNNKSKITYIIVKGEKTCNKPNSVVLQVSWSRRGSRQSCASSRQWTAAGWTQPVGPWGSGPAKHCGGSTVDWLTFRWTPQTTVRPWRCSTRATAWLLSVGQHSLYICV